MVAARALALALAGAVVLGGCGAAAPGPRAGAGAGATPATAAAPPRLAPGARRVAMVVFENEELGQVLGGPQAPYLTALARRYALATGDHAIRHPSLPNYIALLTGTTAGIASDCTATACPVRARSLIDQLEARRRPWRAYVEGLPTPCRPSAQDVVGRYAQRHNPFAYLTRVVGDPRRCHDVVGFGRLVGDERAGRLPAFAWLGPDLCHDMHDCGVRAGDRWLRRVGPGLLRALGPRGLLVITWDEGTTDAACCDGARGGRVGLILAGGAARRGARWRRPSDHFATLATVEAFFGLGRLGAARHRAPLRALLR